MYKTAPRTRGTKTPDGHREKDYWNEIAKTSFQITKKYNGKFERDIVNGLIEEIKRRDHKECEMFRKQIA